MENLDQVLDAGSNSFWNLLLAAVAIGGSLLVARFARRAIRKKLHQYEEVDNYAGAMIGRITGWTIVFLGVVLALVILGVDMAPVVLAIALAAAFLVLSGRTFIENWAAGILLQRPDHDAVQPGIAVAALRRQRSTSPSSSRRAAGAKSGTQLSATRSAIPLRS